MSIFIKLMRNQMRGNKNYGKWFAKTVAMGEKHTDDLARTIEKETTFTRGEVKGMIDALVDTMTMELQSGNTVVLDGFGRFRLVAESISADTPEDFSIRNHIKGVKCRFLPTGKRRSGSRSLSNAFCEGVKVAYAKEDGVGQG